MEEGDVGSINLVARPDLIIIQLNEVYPEGFAPCKIAAVVITH